MAVPSCVLFVCRDLQHAEQIGRGSTIPHKQLLPLSKNLRVLFACTVCANTALASALPQVQDCQ